MRLLIVDDEPPMVDLITMFMQPVCSFIDWTDKLAEAVEKVRTGNFNLIILDLKLGVTGKEEAFRIIRTLKSYNASVLVVSGVVDPHLKEDALAAGADGFIAKGPDFKSDKLLMAANIAVLHLPKESFHSDSFSEHIALLRQTVSNGHPA